MHPERVAGLLADPGSPETKFERLSRSKYLILLTKAPIGKTCAATIYHSVVGCPIIPEDLRFVAKSGMETGAGVEMEPQSIFVKTASKFVPSIVNLMKVTSVTAVEDLKAPRTGQKKKVRNFAVLTPALAEASQYTTMKPAELLVALVECIKARATPRPREAMVIEGEDAQEETTKGGDAGDDSNE